MIIDSRNILIIEFEQNCDYLNSIITNLCNITSNIIIIFV